MDTLGWADRNWPLLRRLMAGHTVVYRATGGLIGHRVPGLAPSLLLDHVGAKSGKSRTSPLVYGVDGENLLLVASKGGALSLSRTLRYVDPLAPRGALYRLFARLVGTRLAGWVSRRVGWKVDPYLLRLTRGRLGFGLVIPTALLETRGARTGRTRR